MAYRNKIYIAFDGDNDIKYYHILEAWNNNPNIDFRFYNAHDLHTSNDSSKKESIKASLRDRFANSKLFILLIGEHTKYLTKFVKWEIETAIRLELPIICINLNNSREPDDLCPSSLNNQLAIFIPFKEKIIKYAIDDWPSCDVQYRKDNKIGHYYYNDNFYNSH